MKRTIILAVLAAVLVCACQQENEEVYSCDKRLNEWAHQNLKAIRSMDREAWQQLDEDYKNPAFNALTPDQKLLFWKDKLKEVMTTLEWNEAEIRHLMKLYQYLDEHPDLYTEDFSNDSIQQATFDEFIRTWTVDAMFDYEWTEELIYGILYTGNRMIDKEGNFQVMHKKRIMNKQESAPDIDCDCNKKYDSECKESNCKEIISGCGPLKSKPCNGRKE